MRDVFKNKRVTCYVCGQTLNGDNLKHRGDRYYCEADFEKTSSEEEIENKFQKERKKNYDKIFGQL